MRFLCLNTAHVSVGDECGWRGISIALAAHSFNRAYRTEN